MISVIRTRRPIEMKRHAGGSRKRSIQLYSEERGGSELEYKEHSSTYNLYILCKIMVTAFKNEKERGRLGKKGDTNYTLILRNRFAN